MCPCRYDMNERLLLLPRMSAFTHPSQYFHASHRCQPHIGTHCPTIIHAAHAHSHAHAPTRACLLGHSIRASCLACGSAHALNCLPWRQNGGIMATAITTHHLSWIIVHHHHHLLASCADDGVRLISSLVSCASDSGPDEDEDETM